MSAKYDLPQSITLPSGEELEHYWSYIPGLGPSWEFQKECARRLKAKIRLIKVLGRNLRGKRDLRGLPYKPSEWIFCTIPRKELYRTELNGREFTYHHHESDTQNMAPGR